MTIYEVVKELEKEKREGIASRFPCRAIMVKNVEQYSILLSELQKIPDISVVKSSELFSSADVMPRYENLTDKRYWDRWVILPGVSEYLRLFSKSEAEKQRFANLWRNQVNASSRGRIIIPMWGCVAQWHDKALRLCDDVRQDPFYYDCVDDTQPDQKLSLAVFSGEFENYIFKLSMQDSQVYTGLQEWYEYWASPSRIRDKQILLTGRYNAVQPMEGNISIRVIKDRFSFLKENLSGASGLTESNCPKEAQELLFEYALDGVSLDQAIVSALNVASFNGKDIMTRWQALELGEKQLAMLWMRMHPDDTYLSYCFQKAEDISSIPDHILHDVFPLRITHPDWEKESQSIVSSMHLKKDARFFAQLDEIPAYAERLGFLSCQEKEERVYLLQMVGKWLREDAKQVHASKALRKVYPALHAYLDSTVYDSDLGRYYSLYKAHKLENSLPEDETLYFSGIQPDEKDYRYPLLSNAITDSCIILWIDALGAEWLPLLTWTLSKTSAGKIVSYDIGQATLPTETCFNEQWKQMNVPYKKLDRLDKLAHKGVVDNSDYYACIEDELTFLSEITSTVEELLIQYDRVIITGDHGTSRLAARFFHTRKGMPVPPKGQVFSHGRYCEVPAECDLSIYEVEPAKDADGKHYAVMKGYDHFIQSGFAAGADDENAIFGEVHGGATPEEMLVPVVVIDSTADRPLTAQWKQSTIKIMSKKVKATLQFSRPVSSVEVGIGPTKAECTSMPDQKTWNIVFRGIKDGVYSVAVNADGSLVPMEPITVMPALGIGDGDLP